MRRSAWPGLLLLLLLTPACAPTVGTACDDVAAHEIVYNRSTGAPAYAGQSILITSCAGGGSFCHTSNALHRYGAPFGMNFDPTLADSRFFASDAAGTSHLLEVRRLTNHFRNAIFAQVSAGTMPPPGAIGDHTIRTPYYRYASDTDTEGTPLPGIRTADGREILRNWLACGSPVVQQRTDPRPVPCTSDADCGITQCDPHPSDPAQRQCLLVGFVVAERTVATQPTWESIYSTVIEENCAYSPCHDAESAPSSGGLDMSTADHAFAALVMADASFPTCGTRIVPGDPEGSFMFQKISGAALGADCGTSMPIGGELQDGQITAIHDWIAAGAMP